MIKVIRLHLSGRANAFQPQGDHLLRQRALGAGYPVECCFTPGLSHPADGRTLPAGDAVPRSPSGGSGRERPSGQGASEIPESRQDIQFRAKVGKKGDIGVYTGSTSGDTEPMGKCTVPVAND